MTRGGLSKKVTFELRLGQESKFGEKKVPGKGNRPKTGKSLMCWRFGEKVR